MIKKILENKDKNLKLTTLGFTLIELLAVIVILAIIALIATPIVLNIIEDSKKSTFVQTGNGIVDAAEYYYMKEMSAGAKPTENKVFTFDGSTNGLEGLEFDGEIPKEGSVIISTEGKVAIGITNNKYCLTKGFEDTDVTVVEDAKNCKNPGEPEPIMTSENNCIKTGNICSSDDIKAGILVNVKVNDQQTEKFYVLADDGNKVTLILNKNLGDNIAWYGESYTGGQNGPITALTYLQSQTSTWTNLPEITIDRFEFDHGHDEILALEFTMYARLPKYSEIYAINNSISLSNTPWLYINLKNTGDDTDSKGYNRMGYWTSEVSAHCEWDGDSMGYYCASTIQYDGNLSSNYYKIDDKDRVGVRPVIELYK